MAHLLSSRASRPCLSCIRQLSLDYPAIFASPIRQQTRGKKKIPASQTIKVELLADIARYGRRGAIMTIPPGRMRNDWYPNKLAAYLTTAQLRALGPDAVVSERDYNFGVEETATEEAEEGHQVQEEKSNSEVGVVRKAQVDLQLLSPTKATALLADLLPDTLDFYRSPIMAEIKAQKRSPSLPADAETSVDATKPDADTAAANAQRSIYGSVTTSDIASNLRAILAVDEEGKKVVLSPEDITFIENDESEEQDRVKRLGIFEFDIRLKGAPDTVRRTIRVNAQA